VTGLADGGRDEVRDEDSGQIDVDLQIQEAACVVEGRYFAVGPKKPIRVVEGIGLVHNAYIPHTIMGDASDPGATSTTTTVDEDVEVDS
jgi:hypothetical protein